MAAVHGYELRKEILASKKREKTAAASAATNLNLSFLTTRPWPNKITTAESIDHLDEQCESSEADAGRNILVEEQAADCSDEMDEEAEEEEEED